MLKTHSDEKLNFTIINPSFNVGTEDGLFNEIKELYSGSAETDIASYNT